MHLLTFSLKTYNKQRIYYTIFYFYYDLLLHFICLILYGANIIIRLSNIIYDADFAGVVITLCSCVIVLPTFDIKLVVASLLDDNDDDFEPLLMYLL